MVRTLAWNTRIPGGARGARQPEPDAIVPSLGNVARRALPQVIEAVLVPAAVLMLVTTIATTTVAIGATLAWGLGTLAWRWVNRRRASGITILAVARLLERVRSSRSWPAARSSTSCTP